MPFSGIEIFAIIFMMIFTVFYFFAFYTIILKRDLQRRFLRRFHNAVCNIYEEVTHTAQVDEDPDSAHTYWFEQLNLNYEKLCQSNPSNNYTSILDLLETIIYYYDSYPDIAFKNVFRQDKKPQIRNFTVDMCLYIKSRNPFISIPRKEADLMQTILDALDSNNKSLGINSLRQLSQEVANKEKLIIKKDKENQRANVVSIVGVILTVFFGILSLIPILSK